LTDTVKQSSADDMIANLRRQITDLQNTAVDAIRQRDAALAHNAPSADIEHTLLRCPFCGGKGMLHQNRTAQALWRVACVNCDAGPHSAFGEFGAARLWNERITDAAQPTPEPIGWRWKWGEADFWKMTDIPSLVPASAPIKEPFYAAPPPRCSAGTESLAPEAMAHMLGIAVSKAEHFLKTFHVSALRPSPWSCAARKQTLPEPAECNWPVCGCDPYADKVIAALEESGHPITTSEVREIVRQLRGGSDNAHKVLAPLLKRAADALERLSATSPLSHPKEK